MPEFPQAVWGNLALHLDKGILLLRYGVKWKIFETSWANPALNIQRLGETKGPLAATGEEFFRWRFPAGGPDAGRFAE